MDTLVKHGLMMVVFSLFTNLFSYLYQLFMGRLLSVSDYGILFSLLSLSYIISVLSSTINTSITKFTSSLKAKGEFSKINYLWKFIIKKGFILGVITFSILTISSPIIVSFLNLQSNYIYPMILFSSFIFMFTLPINFGILQGLQRFFALGISNTALSFFKFVFGVLLITLNLGLIGALFSPFLANLLAFLLTLFLLKDLKGYGNDRFEVKGLYSYSRLTFIAILSYTILTSIDVILVKHYFDPDTAGNYSAISVLGRIVLFAPAGISMAMFPKTSELFEVKGKHLTLFVKAIIYTTLIVGLVIAIYYLYPKLVVDMVFGSNKYTFVTPYIAKYGIAMAFLALTGLAMNYLLSINRTKVAYILAFIASLELVLIFIFHSSIDEVINMVIISSILSFILTIIYLLKTR